MKISMRLGLLAVLISSMFPVLASATADSGAGGKLLPAQEKRDFLPFKATEKLLPNGLKVIIIPTGMPNLISLQIPVQTGARNEFEAGKSGFSHFFEHMMFRGTKEFPPDKYGEILARAGVRPSAYTSDDLTNFHMTFFKDDLETMLKIEADRFQNLSFSENDFRTEAKAVLGEYNKNSNHAIRRLVADVREAAFQKHPYRHVPIGFLKDIEDMPNLYAYSKVFFERWYRPEYTSIVIAGDVDPEKAIALVEKYWGKWQQGKERVKIPVEPAPTAPVYKPVIWSGATLPYVSVSFHAPAFSVENKDHAALQVLFSLVFGEDSELRNRLLQQEQKVDELFDRTTSNADPGLVTVIARVKKPGDVIYVRNAILEKMADIVQNPVSEKELADAKTKHKYELIRSLDNTEQIASTLALYIHYQRSYATFDQFQKIIDELTPADLLAAAKKYLRDEGMVVTTMSDAALPAGVEKLPGLNSFNKTSSASKFNILVQASSLPQVSFKLIFNAGSVHDPVGKEGLAALTAAMLASADSTERKVDEIRQMLSPLAASFSVQTDKEMTSFTGTVHKDNWETLMRTAMPQLLTPGFREEDFLRLKDAQKNALLRDLKNNNDEELAKEVLQSMAFSGSAFAHPVLGTIKGLDAITLDDVRQFWRQAYTKGAVHAGIAGDVNTSMLASLQQALNQLPQGQGFTRLAAPVIPRHAGLAVQIIQKDNRSTAISLGLPIEVTRSHPDFAALWLVKTWLGEHRSSLAYLTKRIREVRGLNYGTYAYIEAFPRGMFEFLPIANRARQAQLFEIWIRPTLPENAEMALRISLSELDKLIQQGLSKDQFEMIRDYLMKNVFMMMASQDQQLAYALDAQWLGTPEFTQMMRTQLSKLTVEDVNAAIKRHLNAENMSIVMVAKDAENLKEHLLADRPLPIKYDVAQPKELLEEDRVIGQRKLNIKASSINILPVQQVFAE
ncbi:M16 family metallopeptidase [Undibacterium sp. JH2W]|uniref:M16 family metallopeptidase n=1 Tax=Undibacterium sp. JH2W TaxID=3413037 RepID=UPI003BF3FFD2